MYRRNRASGSNRFELRGRFWPKRRSGRESLAIASLARRAEQGAGSLEQGIGRATGPSLFGDRHILPTFDSSERRKSQGLAEFLTADERRRVGLFRSRNHESDELHEWGNRGLLFVGFV